MIDTKIKKNFIITSISSLKNSFKEARVFGKYIKEKQISFIAKSLAEIYKDGIPLDKALILVEESVSDRRYKKSLRTVLYWMNSGKSLTESFSKCSMFYPELFIGFISIGENTGQLYKILIQLGDYYDKSSEIKSEVKSATIYPAFIILSLMVMIAVFIDKIIPSFYNIYTSMGITPSYFYRIIYDFQNDFKENYLINMFSILCIISADVIAVRMIICNERLQRLMNLSIVKDVFEYMTILLFSIITTSGISILQGLDYCAGSITPQYLNKKIINIRNNILKGNTLSESLEKSGLLSNYSLSVIKIKEETGSIDEGFKSLSIRMEKQIHNKINRCLKLLSPILIIVMGIIVFIFISVFVLPLFKELQRGIR
ncbi:type II secretion system F family protein [uncultured Clostridium sp.]|uniref:type II secretion system F family protein n=1 Tax=uncultured Clostridium sp. TaxID=59620 RepID=UPI0025EC8A73|nr:type II secretion system F family protein [uncultured Clostridium sp.]